MVEQNDNDYSDHDSEGSLAPRLSSVSITTGDERENLEIGSSFVPYHVEDITISKKCYFMLFNITSFPKVLAYLFITVQRWATMYLDHQYVTR